MSSVFVTGGAGFIGSALVRQIIAATDAAVVTLDKLTYAGNLQSLGEARVRPRHTFVQGDIGDAVAVRALLEAHRPSVLCHIAAESHVDRSIDGPGEFIQTNLVGTFQLLQESLRYWRSLDDAAKAAFRFVHISTDEVFGSLSATGSFTETTPHDLSSPYSASKAGSDHLARAWQRTYGLPIVVTNCSNNYGQYQFPEKLIPLIIRKAVEGAPLPVYGKGDNIRDWLYVDDHARALRLAASHGVPGDTYNIGGQNERQNIDVVHGICALLDELRPDSAGQHKRLITHVTDRPGHDHWYAIDASKLRRELGWVPKENFDSGLRRTVQWFLDNQAWMNDITSGAYRGERLGAGATE